jgi:hypothetical protein
MKSFRSPHELHPSVVREFLDPIDAAMDSLQPALRVKDHRGGDQTRFAYPEPFKRVTREDRDAGRKEIGIPRAGFGTKSDGRNLAKIAAMCGTIARTPTPLPCFPARSACTSPLGEAKFAQRCYGGVRCTSPALENSLSCGVPGFERDALQNGIRPEMIQAL